MEPSNVAYAAGTNMANTRHNNAETRDFMLFSFQIARGTSLVARLGITYTSARIFVGKLAEAF